MSHVRRCVYGAHLRSVGWTQDVSPLANKRANISSTIRLMLDNCRLVIAVLMMKSEVTVTQLALQAVSASVYVAMTMSKPHATQGDASLIGVSCCLYMQLLFTNTWYRTNKETMKQ